ncbi:hypothetical protein [Rhodococcus qingshengii]|nr:hypothetical protein [Rhodococcus qingshengii]
MRALTGDTQARRVAVRVTDVGGTNFVEVDMLVLADAVIEASA